MPQWFCAKEGATHGPFTFEELKGLCSRGSLTPADHVWNEELAAWLSTTEVEGLLPRDTQHDTPVLPMASAAAAPPNSLRREATGPAPDIEPARVGAMSPSMAPIVATASASDPVAASAPVPALAPLPARPPTPASPAPATVAPARAGVAGATWSVSAPAPGAARSKTPPPLVPNKAAASARPSQGAGVSAPHPGSASTGSPLPAARPTAAQTPAATALEPDADTKKAVRTAWIAACVSGCFTLGAIVVVKALRIEGSFIDGWALLDVLLLFGLAYGIARMNRACAAFMVVYWIASKLTIMVQMGKPTGLPLALLFGYFFVKGAQATFAWHSRRKEQPL